MFQEDGIGGQPAEAMTIGSFTTGKTALLLACDRRLASTGLDTHEPFQNRLSKAGIWPVNER